jgi:hypothetical protein
MLTHSLKATGFKPVPLNINHGFQNIPFKLNLCRYTPASSRSRRASALEFSDGQAMKKRFNAGAHNMSSEKDFSLALDGSICSYVLSTLQALTREFFFSLTTTEATMLIPQLSLKSSN